MFSIQIYISFDSGHAVDVFRDIYSVPTCIPVEPQFNVFRDVNSVPTFILVGLQFDVVTQSSEYSNISGDRNYLC